MLRGFFGLCALERLLPRLLELLLAELGGTARGLNALMKIREAYEGRIPIESAPLEGTPSKDELYAMVADPKYNSDPAYRQKVERMFRTYVKE